MTDSATKIEQAKKQMRASVQPAVHEVPAPRNADVARPQYPALIRVLFKEAMRRQHRLADIAKALGVSSAYLAQLRSGRRHTEHISEQFSEACARYLGVPTALVKLWSGRISMRDFVWPTRSGKVDVENGLRTLRDDPAVASWIPAALYTADETVKEFVWQLYQEGSGLYSEELRLMPHALDFLQRAALLEAEYEAKVAQMRRDAAAT